MSFTDPAAITYNAVVTNLNRNNQDNYGATYDAESAAGEKMTLTIKHTIPATGKPGESHLARYDVEQYDVSGILLRKTSAWLSIRTDFGIQNAVSAENAAKALLAYLSASSYANVAKLVSRQN